MAIVVGLCWCHHMMTGWLFVLQEWRHAHGMRCLGIPNTAHFANVTQIEDAIAREYATVRAIRAAHIVPKLIEHVHLFLVCSCIWTYVCVSYLQCGRRSSHGRIPIDGSQRPRWDVHTVAYVLPLALPRLDSLHVASDNTIRHIRAYVFIASAL